MPFFTIIVPIFRAEAFLHKCIDSILTQSFQSLELILVDDGSPDRSGLICDQYAAKDNRIRVVHKQNQGVSAARNMALSLAQGNYILFVDADDYIIPNSLALIAEALQRDNLDYLQFSIASSTPNGNIQPWQGRNSQILDANAFINFQKDFPYMWDAAYRRDIITNNNLRLDDRLKWMEDTIFKYQFIRCCKRLRRLDIPVYVYIANPQSVTKSPPPEALISSYRALRDYFNIPDLHFEYITFHWLYLLSAEPASVAPISLLCELSRGQDFSHTRHHRASSRIFFILDPISRPLALWSMRQANRLSSLLRTIHPHHNP